MNVQCSTHKKPLFCRLKTEQLFFCFLPICRRRDVDYRTAKCTLNELATRSAVAWKNKIDMMRCFFKGSVLKWRHWRNSWNFDDFIENFLNHFDGFKKFLEFFWIFSALLHWSSHTNPILIWGHSTNWYKVRLARYIAKKPIMTHWIWYQVKKV